MDFLGGWIKILRLTILQEMCWLSFFQENSGRPPSWSCFFASMVLLKREASGEKAQRGVCLWLRRLRESSGGSLLYHVLQDVLFHSFIDGANLICLRPKSVLQKQLHFK